MPNFTDNTGHTWNLHITTKDVTLVERLVKDRNGKPVDLLGMADTGDIYQISGNSRLMIDIVFVCVLDQAKPLFKEDEFDASHQLEYTIEPELKNDTLRKMGMWFGERIDVAAIGAMTDAFKEALVLFTRNPRQREALERAIETEKKMEDAQAERMILRANDWLEKVNTKMDQILQTELGKTPDELFQELPFPPHGPNG